MPVEQSTLGFSAIGIIGGDQLPPAGATHGQVIALAVYIESPPDGPSTTYYPVPAGKAPNGVRLTVVWAGHPSVGRGGKAWEG